MDDVILATLIADDTNMEQVRWQKTEGQGESAMVCLDQIIEVPALKQNQQK